jgi:hypothetical protein
MLDLQRTVPLVAVSTLPIPLLQEIFAHLIALQRPLLVINSPDLGSLQRLRIKPDQLETEDSDRTPAPDALDPGDDVLDATLQRGW